MNIDIAKVRRETMRWLVLRALDYGRPSPLHETLLLSTVQGIFSDATQHELRRETDYLENRRMVNIDRRPDGSWWVDLTRLGVDLVEYNIECDPGIARPPRI